MGNHHMYSHIILPKGQHFAHQAQITKPVRVAHGSILHRCSGLVLARFRLSGGSGSLGFHSWPKRPRTHEDPNQGPVYCNWAPKASRMMAVWSRFRGFWAAVLRNCFTSGVGVFSFMCLRSRYGLSAQSPSPAWSFMELDAQRSIGEFEPEPTRQRVLVCSDRF